MTTITRKEFNRKETIRHIRAVFISLYAKVGLDGVTVSDICRESGIAKSTFYAYFDDKYSVLESIEQELLDGLATINPELEDCDMEDVRMGVPLDKAIKTVAFIKLHRREYRTILGPHGDPTFENRWKKNIADSFVSRFKLEQGDARSGGIACAIFSSSLVGLYRYFIFDDPAITEKEFSIILGNTLKYALFDFHAFAE